MDIGKEDAPYVIEPVESPIPSREPVTTPEPERVQEPEKVPA